MSDYKASAIVSSYASEKYIHGCLEDLTQQTLFKMGALQIIVIDSNSPENESEIVAEFQRSYPGIVYHRSLERETLYGAWNTGLTFAKGQYITNANTDDRHRPDAIEVLTRALDNNPNCDLAYANCLSTESANETFFKNSAKKTYRFKPFFAPEVVLHYQFGPQPVWRKCLHDRIGVFNPDYCAAGDWDFNYRFNLAGCRAIHIPETLGLFFDSPQSVSRSNSTSFDEQLTLRNKYGSCDNILSLYRHDGWKLDLALQKASALNHFGVRAARFYLPWAPDEVFTDLGFAIQAFNEAIKLTPDKPELINNLASVLGISGRPQDALILYNSCGAQSEMFLKNIQYIREGRLDLLGFCEKL